LQIFRKYLIRHSTKKRATRVAAGVFSAGLAALAASRSLEARAEAALSLAQCAQKAAENNADLGAAAAAVKIAQGQLTGSYSNFLPQLSAAASYTDSSISGVVPSPGALTQSVAIQNQYTESLSLNQSLFNGFADLGKYRQAEANLHAAKAQLAVEKATLAAAVKTAYAQLLFQQKSVELTDAIFKRQKNNLRMISLNFKGGSENKGNMLYQEGIVAQADYQHQHAIRQLRNAMKQLGALWGEPNIPSLRVTGELEWSVPKAQPNYEEIAAKHPNHENFVQQWAAADAGVLMADGGWYPNFNLLGSVGQVGSNWPPDQQRWSIGLSMTFPFFPGTAQISAAEAARATRAQAEQQKRSADFKLIAALESAYEGFLDSAGQVEVARTFKVAAEARSKIANGRYNSGLMTFEDWSVIDADLVTREQNLLQAELNAMQAEAAWESAEGIGAIP
jgi:outer membrane protein TolC